MNRRPFAAALAFTLMVTLGACGSDSDEVSTNRESTTKPRPPDPKALQPIPAPTRAPTRPGTAAPGLTPPTPIPPSSTPPPRKPRSW